MGQSRALFVYFRLFNISQFKFKLIKAWTVCLGFEPEGGRMEDADESTELRRHPTNLNSKRDPWVPNSGTRLSNFKYVFLTKYLTKTAQILANYCGYFEKWHFLKNLGYFFAPTPGHTGVKLWKEMFSNVHKLWSCGRGNWLITAKVFG